MYDPKNLSHWSCAMRPWHIIAATILLNVSVSFMGCNGCENQPIHQPAGGAGGDLSVVDPCDLACEHAATMGCPQAATEGDVTCSELCRQVPVLRDSAKCAATSSDCAAFDNCSSTPDGG